MKNKEDWRPSVYEIRKGKLRATKDTKKLFIASRLIVEKVAKFYDENIPKYAQGQLIDLGCGNVPLYGKYKTYVNDVTCVDWANTLHKNPHLDYECDLNSKMDVITDSMYDTIILSDVLEHISKPDILISEMHRILKPTGKIIMNVPFYYWLHENPYDFYRYTQHSLKMIFEEKGFRIIDIKIMGGPLEILADVSSKLSVMIVPGGKFVAIFIQRITSLIGRTFLGKKIRRRTEHLFPLGYGLVLEKNH